MKREQKKKQMDERSKHLVMYLSLLAAAAFFAFQNPENAWLAIGISAGVLFSLLFSRIRDRKRKQDPPEVSTEKEETVENKEKPKE